MHKLGLAALASLAMLGTGCGLHPTDGSDSGPAVFLGGSCGATTWRKSVAMPFLDKADALLRAEGLLDDRVEPHLIGLRGQVLYTSGQLASGLPQLERAWELAPEVWADGRLSAAELY